MIMIYDQSLDITETTNLLKSFSFGSKKNKESTDQSFISISEQKLQRVLRLLLTQINTIQQVLDELQPKHTHTHTHCWNLIMKWFTKMTMRFQE